MSQQFLDLPGLTLYDEKIKEWFQSKGAKTVTGNPVVITDAEPMNAESVVATITPTQTGSGTPSPSNVRPFVGFSSVDVTRYGKNLLRNSKYAYNQFNIFIGAVDANDYEVFLPAGTYAISVYYASGTLSSNKEISYAIRDGSVKNLPNGQSSGVISLSESGYYRFWVHSSSGSISVNDIDHFQLEANNQVTTYEPYQGQVYAVQLGDTYYGATLDVTTGKLVSNYGFVDIGSLNFDAKEGTDDCALFRTAFNSIPNPLLGNINYVGTSKCSCFKYDSGTNVVGLTPETINMGYSYSPRVRIATEYYKSMSVEEFKTAMSGQKLCYELATPIEIQLTPQQIELLENNNTITTNASSLDVKYKTNTTIGDTLSVLDKRITQLDGGKADTLSFDNATRVLSLKSGNTVLSSVTIPTVKIVPFSSGTDGEIAAMIAAADRGEIDLYADAGWRVGDERQITIDAMEASGTYDGVTWSVGESHAEQTVTLILLDGGTTSETGDAFTGSATSDYELVKSVYNKDGTRRTNPAFIVGLKGILGTTGYMNPTKTNSGSWGGCARRNWCNGAFRESLNALIPAFKQFKTITTEAWGSATLQTTQDYFTFAAAKEVYGSDDHASNENERNALKQFAYYAPRDNRKKGVQYWERSPRYSQGFMVYNWVDSSSTDHYTDENYGISPIGCI